MAPAGSGVHDADDKNASTVASSSSSVGVYDRSPALTVVQAAALSQHDADDDDD